MVSFRGVLLALAVAAFVLVAGAEVARAATYNVTDTTDAPLSTSSSTTCASTHSGSCTLRAAVQAADNNGGSNTINLPAGDYQLTVPPSCPSYTSTGDLDGCDANDPTQGDLDVLAGDSLTVTGGGSGTTTVDAAGIDRAFAVQHGASLSLSGMTIEDGTPGSQQCTATDYGGYPYTCFLSDYPTTVSGCCGVFAAGGGVYSDGVLTTTADVVFRNDQAPTAAYETGEGGAIYPDADSTLSLTGASFISDFAPKGSAIYDATPAAVTISGSTFTGNDTSGGQGTIYGEGSSGSLDITGSTFSDNTSGSGGVLDWQSGNELSAANSTFTGNSATTGGVIYNTGQSHATSLTGDVFKNNTAYEAAVIYQNDNSGPNDSVTLNDDEVDSNQATYVGVGDFNQGAGVTSSDSSYIGNSGAYGGVFDLATGNPSSLTNVTMSSNSSSYGGAIYISSGAARPLDLTNDTIAFNSATASGGGIYGAAGASAGTNGVINTIVAENSGGDCGGGSFSSMDGGNNLDSDSSCFGYSGHPDSDKPGVNPNLSMPAYNGGPNHVQTDAEHADSASVHAGANACPATDARGLSRAHPCDIGAFELLPAGLSVASGAPATGVTGQPFTYTITVSNGAGAPSTGTTLTAQLPAGETLYGATPSQGSCQSSGNPATLTCALGLLTPGTSATIQLVVAGANPGAVVNTATVTNDQGQSQTTSATTTLTAPGGSGTPPPTPTPTPSPSPTPAPAGSAPTAVTGSASSITTSTATLSGQITPGGQATAFFFQFGTSKTYGEVSTIGRTGSTSTTVKAVLTHLAAHTTYHYRLIAINGSGTSYGRDMTFKTAGTSPGSVLLTKRTLKVKHGKARIPLRCTSGGACRGKVRIITSIQRPGRRTRTIACTAKPVAYNVGAKAHKMVSAAIDKACRAALSDHAGKLAANLVIHPITPQPSLTQGVTLIM